MKHVLLVLPLVALMLLAVSAALPASTIRNAAFALDDGGWHAPAHQLVRFAAWRGDGTAKYASAQAAHHGRTSRAARPAFLFEPQDPGEANYVRARPLYEAAARALAASSDPDDGALLAHMHLRGEGVERDTARAIVLLEAALDAGSELGARIAALQAMRAGDHARAERYLQRAHSLGYGWATSLRASNASASHEDDVDAFRAEVAVLYEAARQGDAEADAALAQRRAELERAAASEPRAVALLDSMAVWTAP